MFGCSGVVCLLAGKVCKVVLQAMLKTGTAFENHTSNSYLYLQMVKNNMPAYLYAIPDTFLLPSETFTMITLKRDSRAKQMAMTPFPGHVPKQQLVSR